MNDPDYLGLGGCGLCVNSPYGGPFDPAGPPGMSMASRAMADTALRWDPGSELSVYFLPGGGDWAEAIRTAVKRLAPEWSKAANVRFKFVSTPEAHITVNLSPGRGGASYGMYSCYLGTDCLAMIGRGVPAMHLVFPPNLAQNPALMESEFRRVILHEFGHALGFVHEHMRPDRPIVWDVPALNRYCLRYFGWDAGTVKAQIVDEYRPRKPGSMTSGDFDPKSVMMYSYPDGLARYTDGRPFSTPNNTELTPMDKAVAAMVYPFGTGGGGTGGGTSGGGQGGGETLIRPGATPLGASIAQAGDVARFRFVPDEATDYTVGCRSSVPLLLTVLAERGNPNGKSLAGEGKSASVRFHPINPGRQYFAEVRASKPGATGEFTIGVTPAKRKGTRVVSTWDEAGSFDP